MAINLPSDKPSKEDEQDTLDTDDEVRTFFYGFLHMADQQKLTVFTSLQTLGDV